MTSRAAEWLQVPPEGGADGHILIGAPAWFTVDGLGSSTYQGVVEEISPAVGSEFSIMSTDNVIGSFVKILQRIQDSPADFSQDPYRWQHAGAPAPRHVVEAFIDTATGTR